MKILKKLNRIEKMLHEHLPFLENDYGKQIKEIIEDLKEENNIEKFYNLLLQILKDLLENLNRQVYQLKTNVQDIIEDIIEEVKILITMIQSQLSNIRDRFPNFSTVLQTYNLIRKFPNVPVVDFVDIDAYMGKWFQYKANLLAVGVESFGTKNTATYSKIDDTTIKVLNENRTILGRKNSIEGQAVLLDPPTGNLKVSFTNFNFDLSMDGNYRIVKLGKIKNGQYTYSIVLSPMNWFIFVLVRDLNDKTILNEVDYVLKELDITNVFSQLLTV